MKTNFFYLALVALTLMGFTACSNDDDNEVDKVYPVTLTTLANADNAVVYNLETAVKPSDALGEYELNSLEMTEGNKIVVGLRETTTQKQTYVMGNVSASGNTYTVSGGKVSGTVRVTSDANVRQTRASSETELIIDLTVTAGGNFTYTTEGGSVKTVAITQATTNDEVMGYLVRTWNILGGIIDLRNNQRSIKAYEEFDSKNGVFDLEDVLKEALDQGVSLKQNEQDALKRKISSVTFTQSGLFIITYTDGMEDVAEWSWNNAAKTQIRIKLKNNDMGNRFFNDNTSIGVAFNGNRCNIKLQTTVNDNNGEKWDALLTLKLQSAE